MKKVIFYYLMIGFLVYFTQEANAQINGRVNYKAIFESADFEEMEARLIFNNEESLFSIKNEKTGNSKTSSSVNPGDGTVKIDLVAKSRETIYDLYINRKENEIIRGELYFKDGSFHDCLVVESTGLINWEINTETKPVGSFNTVKAIASFRGRNYTAWFAPDIPISLGPWIFHGLPGLILELYDEEMGVQFYMSSLEFLFL